MPLAASGLSSAPRGDGHGVLVVPGLLASDVSTGVLRRFLRRLGYDAAGWDLGRNRGPTDQVVDELPRVLSALAQRTGRPVSLIGWSLGGIYARELARQHPAEDPAPRGGATRGRGTRGGATRGRCCARQAPDCS